MTDPHRQLWEDYLRLLNFAMRFLNPDDLGHSVSAEVRDAARVALGREPVEGKKNG
jgi:predicted nucleotide-binding protein